MRLFTITISMMMAGSTALLGCDPGGADGGGTTEDATTTMMASGSDSSGDTPPANMCQETREVPPAPVDCSSATEVLTGSVFIEEDGDDPSVLEGVVEVTGQIRINRSAVTDLNFMACVKTVGDQIQIFGNEQLTNVDGLWSITEIGTDFVFSENNALTEFNGLPNLMAARQGIIIKSNASLEKISGFHSLVGTEGSLTIQNNEALTDIDGLGGLRVLNGNLSVTNNSQLCISSVNCVGSGITQPAMPPDDWSTVGNNNDC